MSRTSSAGPEGSETPVARPGARAMATAPPATLAPAPTRAEPVRAGGVSGIALVVFAILAVAAAMLARLALSMLAASRLAARGEDVSDRDSRSELDRARRDLGLRRTVRLRISERVAVPVISGVLHPTLLLPPEAAAWPPRILHFASRYFFLNPVVTFAPRVSSICFAPSAYGPVGCSSRYLLKSSTVPGGATIFPCLSTVAFCSELTAR